MCEPFVMRFFTSSPDDTSNNFSLSLLWFILLRIFVTPLLSIANKELQSPASYEKIFLKWRLKSQSCGAVLPSSSICLSTPPPLALKGFKLRKDCTWNNVAVDVLYNPYLLVHSLLKINRCTCLITVYF